MQRNKRANKKGRRKQVKTNKNGRRSLEQKYINHEIERKERSTRTNQNDSIERLLYEVVKRKINVEKTQKNDTENRKDTKKMIIKKEEVSITTE